MHIHIDRHAHFQTRIHVWDPRFKIASLFILLMVFAFVDKLLLLPIIFAIALLLVVISQIPANYLWKTLRYPLAFLLLLWGFLAITSGGQVWYTFWKIKVFDAGVILGIIIVVRSITQMMLVLVILETTPFNSTIKALYLLKIPEKLVAIAFFSLHYVYVYLEQLRKMKTAARLRGSGQKRSNFSMTAGIVGSLMVRSFEQAERVHSAMVLRGYSNNFFVHHDFHSEPADYRKSFYALIVAISILGGNWLL